MRARHRHFNQRDAGGVFVLDSRRISGLSDNDPISQWDDASRNTTNASQSTSSLRPVYRTSIQGGQPVVRFNVASNFLSATVTSDFGCLFCVGNISANIQKFAGIITARVSPNSTLVSASSNNFGMTTTSGLQRSERLTGFLGNTSSVFAQGVSGSTSDFENFNGGLVVNNPFIICAFRASDVSGTHNFSIGRDTFQGADAPRALDDGDIAVIALLPSGITSSLRKKIEHSAAFSFKISCS